MPENKFENKIKRYSVRCVSAILMCFALVFGTTYGKTGYCLGDEVFKSLGLSVWSDGMEGTHYPAVLALILLLIGYVLFMATIKNRDRFFKYFLTGIFVAVICVIIANFLYITI